LESKNVWNAKTESIKTKIRNNLGREQTLSFHLKNKNKHKQKEEEEVETYILEGKDNDVFTTLEVAQHKSN
jgi:hypothetical protein